MESGRKAVMPLAWLVATGLSALGWWFGSGLQPSWWLTWLAPLPVLWMATRVRAPWAALAAIVAYAAGGLSQWSYMHERIGLPMPVILGFIALPGVVLALCVLLFRRLVLRGHAVAAAFAVPCLWVAIDYLSNLASPHGTFGNIAYTQLDNLVMLQTAAVTGIWGIGFLLLLLPSAVAALLATQAAGRDRWVIAGSVAALMVIAIAYGHLRLQMPSETSVSVGLVSLEKPIRPASDSEEGQALQARYVDAIQRLAHAGASIVVTPETSFSTPSASMPAFAMLAEQHGLTLGMGVDAKGNRDAERNMLDVFQPGAVSPALYSKHHLIPGLEHQYTPGDSYTVLQGTLRIGLAVCKDMDFHDVTRAYAARHAQLLLVPAWDFGVDGWLHSRMAIMRGVEGGFAIARVARSGRLTLSDDRGRVVAEASSEDHDASLVGKLPVRDTSTFYARSGDWAAWLCLIGTLAALLLALARQVRLR
jgi:apolipoprotein N-acyltransferase